MSSQPHLTWHESWDGKDLLPMLDVGDQPSAEAFAGHQARCRTCQALHDYAESRGDAVLLKAWWDQASEHVKNDLAYDSVDVDREFWRVVTP